MKILHSSFRYTDRFLNVFFSVLAVLLSVSRKTKKKRLSYRKKDIEEFVWEASLFWLHVLILKSFFVALFVCFEERKRWNMYIHQDYQPWKLSLCPMDKIPCEQAHFPQVLYAKYYSKTMSNEFYAHFSTDDIYRSTDDFYAMCPHLQIAFPEHFNCAISRVSFCKVLWFEITRCDCFQHLIITRFFFLMRWQACRLCRSTDIRVSDSAWHKDCSRTLSAITEGTGLISRVSFLSHWALLRLLPSNSVILRSSRSSLQHLETERLKLTVLYTASK